MVPVCNQLLSHLFNKMVIFIFTHVNEVCVVMVVKQLINGFLFITGIHPTSISESFQNAAEKSLEVLQEISTPVELSDRDSLLKSASTSLNSKVSYHGYLL
jgi:chaperonin GroEL (HSP60 family)